MMTTWMIISTWISGGVEDLDHLPLPSFRKGLVGCISDFSIGHMFNVNLIAKASKGQNVENCSKAFNEWLNHIMILTSDWLHHVVLIVISIAHTYTHCIIVTHVHSHTKTSYFTACYTYIIPVFQFRSPSTTVYYIHKCASIENLDKQLTPTFTS